MTEQKQSSLAEQLIALGTAANGRLIDELNSKPFNETRYKIVKSLAKFLTIGTQIKLAPSDHKFDDLIGVLTATHTHESDNPFEPDYSVPALKKVAERLRLKNGESVDAKVSVLSDDSACDSLEDELFITESKLTDDSRPNLQDLMQLAHPSEVEWCPDEVNIDSSLHSVVTELWWFVIDDKAKCNCQQAENGPHHLQRPLLSLCPCQDGSGNFTFDILFKTACTFTSAESSLNCVHESSVTIKSEPLKQPVSNGLSIGKLCEELKNTHGKRLPLCIHNDTDSIYPATMTAGTPENEMRFGPAQTAFSLDDDVRFEKLDAFEKVKLAADLSSSFYHFYGTRWMSCPWRCRQLQKFETHESLTGEDCVHTPLLLSYHHENEANQKDWALAPEEHRRLLGRCWPQLFAFGLILLELMCNSTTRRKSREILDKISLWERYCAARELRMTVEKNLHPIVDDILDNIFENSLFQDAVHNEDLERRRYIISAKVTANMKKLQHLCKVKAQQQKRPALSTNGVEATRPNLLFRGFIDRILKPRCLKEVSKSVGWVERFVNINEKVIRNLHTVEPVSPGSGLDTRWMPSRPIRIAILDSGYDPNSQFFKDQEDFGNSGIKDRITWKDFIGDGPPEDKHEERHGTKLLCLMLMLLPMAEIFVGRVALNKTYTESTKFVGPLVEAIDFATKIWGVDVITISLGVDVPSEPRLEGAIKRACQYRDDRILFFAASGNEGRGEDERYPAHYSEHVIGVRGAYANGTINSAYDPNIRSGSGEADPRFATLGTEVPYGELSADRKKALQVSGTSIATPILAATAVTFLQFASFAAWYKPRVEKHLRVLFERKGMVALFRKIGRHVTTDKRVFISPWMLFNVQNWEDWESLPQEMLDGWIQTMCDATKTV